MTDKKGVDKGENVLPYSSAPLGCQARLAMIPRGKITRNNALTRKTNIARRKNTTMDFAVNYS